MRDPKAVERTCIDCNTTFPKGEKRYNERPYIGQYCEDHDSVQRDDSDHE